MHGKIAEKGDGRMLWRFLKMRKQLENDMQPPSESLSYWNEASQPDDPIVLWRYQTDFYRGTPQRTGFLINQPTLQNGKLIGIDVGCFLLPCSSQPNFFIPGFSPTFLPQPVC